MERPYPSDEINQGRDERNESLGALLTARANSIDHCWQAANYTKVHVLGRLSVPMEKELAENNLLSNCRRRGEHH
jgi:hypothetical protein